MLHHRLEKYVLAILTEYPQGISEYQLIVKLQDAPYQVFDKTAMSETLTLFQCHFVLFHCLYQIRARSLLAQQYDVQIAVTNIKLLPFVKAQGGLGSVDKLQNYYLDWQNFAQTSVQDVEKLLNQFWNTMAGVKEPVDLELVTQAYKTFDLPFDSKFKVVKSAYLRLQHQHHPDKGGNKTQSQQLEMQFQLLKRYLK